MKKTVQLKLLVTASQFEMLTSDLALCNEQANVVARVACERSIGCNRDLRKVTYEDVRVAGLASQAAQHVIKKVADALATRRARAKNGGYGKPGSDRYEKIMNKPVSFRWNAAQPFDRRNMAWQHERSLLALTMRTGARVTDIVYAGRDSDVELVRSGVGECDLLHRDGEFYLMCTVDVPEPVVVQPDGFLGVDMGVVVIAAVADDTGRPVADWSGGAVTARRKKNIEVRRQLQRKGTRSARRRLHARKRKETRFVRDVNHQISKNIIEQAKRTGRGVAIEDLSGIRERVRLRKPQRSMVHNWAFAQLGEMLHYKGCASGVLVVEVDPRYTSQTCSRCGHRDKKSRVSQADFVCRSCGVSLNADMNAAVNIARRGVDSQVAVNLP